MSESAPVLPAAFRLPGFGFVKAEGPDAASFLQSQLSSDLRGLSDGDAQWSALLNPQGRVIAFFALFRVNAVCFRLLLPAEAVDPAIAHLRRFQLRSKLALSGDPLPVAGGWLASGPAPSGSLCTTTRWFGVGDAALPMLADAAARRWALGDIDEGLTWLSADQREQFVAQMLGLDQLGALSLKKGCYPGQEIVARAHYRGAVKRRLVRLRLSAPIQAGDRVKAMRTGLECGVVLSSATTEDASRALAVVLAEPIESDYVIVRDELAIASAERD
jgi:folate-binding protein YgfZ